MRKYIKIKIGAKYGYLTVLREVERSKRGEKMIEAKCICGIIRCYPSAKLHYGNRKSCGCMKSKLCADAQRKHGKTKTRIYHIWRNMISRCTNLNAVNYERYGARGINVTSQWLKFDNFWNDMGKNYEKHIKKFGEKNTTLERKDNNLGYSPENCIWTTLKKQARNKRNTRFIEFNGIKQPASFWAEKFGLDYHTFMTRLYNNWPIEKALTTPVRA
jgi:hypothetical protein